ncbi:MAG: tRNA (guanosine(37)-N1)-methyltransferase TrmD, partial [Actinomycetia bacterium]|nr:tRNA (guanosine(37)-N1)-methyltransferase TrmD [Actinomycetes bacterium]
RAQGLLELVNHDLRQWTHDRHRSTDDEPFGGGQGLLMKVGPVFEALDELLSSTQPPALVLAFAPFGQVLNQQLVSELAAAERLVLLCGHYEGWDERVYSRVDRVISLGDFILTGGELPALCLIDAICRLLPGALGDEQSAVEESFSNGLLEYPQYTRPAVYRGLAVPSVLLGGNHAQIRQWRREQSIIKTACWRPDLLAKADLSPTERQWLANLPTAAPVESSHSAVDQVESAHE